MKKQTLFIFLTVISVSVFALADENKDPCPSQLPEAFSKELRKSHGHEFALGGHKFKLVSPSSWKSLDRDYFRRSDEFQKEIEFKNFIEGKCYYEVAPKDVTKLKTIGLWLKVS